MVDFQTQNVPVETAVKLCAKHQIVNPKIFVAQIGKPIRAEFTLIFRIKIENLFTKEKLGKKFFP